MKIVLLDYGTLGPEIDLSPLRSAGDLIAYEMTAQEEIAERIQDADVVITNKLKLNRQCMTLAKHLKLLCVTATGYDNVDIPFCTEQGIAVCNVPGYSTDSVAQLTIAVALALSTKLLTYRDHVHSGYYSRSGIPNILTPVWHELAGKTWGIVGLGNIGKRVAKVSMSAFSYSSEGVLLLTRPLHPKASATFATLFPMFPSPTMPQVLPISSL